MASTYLTRTPSSASNRKTWTWSGWIKLGVLGTDRNLFGAYANSNDNFKINIADTDQVSMRFYNGSEFQLGLNRVFRDTSAWYHLVFAVDTTLNTAADRFKIYVNGARESSFAAEDQPTQDLQMTINNTTATQIGRFNTGSYFDGSMAMVEFVDGQAYGPEYFGSTDSNTGIWKPGGSSAIADYGTNGFKLAMDTTSPGADTSGKGNTFTPSGTPTLTQGSPSNVYANMATPTWYNGTISNGGTTIGSSGATAYRYQTASIGMSSGKFYWEVKLITLGDYMLTGITGSTNYVTGSTNILGSQATDYSVVYNTSGGNGHKYNNAGASPSNTPGAFMGGFSTNDILTFALDCDNNTLKIGANGQWSNGSGATNKTFANTTAIAITAPASTPSGFYFPACGEYGGADDVWSWNFGEGFFGTTAAGTQADDNGQGLFAYDVPAGYYALNTKNLEAYG